MISISGPITDKYDSDSKVAKDLNSIVKRLAAKDPDLWGDAAIAEAKTRLNWIDLPIASRDLLPQLDALSAWARTRELTNIVLCGMGGSSLAPEVIARTYGKRLTVLDTTDPEQINMAIPEDLSGTLVIVGSKSGSTIETASQKKFFEKLFVEAGLNPADHFVIVTDPDSPLDKSSRNSELRVINADPNVGGRFSALSAFGLVPAALLGVDVSVLLDDADVASQTFSQPNCVAVKIATLLFEQTVQNFSLQDGASNVPGLSDWIEQLVAESTGKDQKGRLPIVVESSSATVGGPNITVGFTEAGSDLNVVASLGEHFILWEWVTALLCRALEVDPFNQPNVTEAKERTGELLSSNNQKSAEIAATFETENLKVFSNYTQKNVTGVLKELTSHAGQYFAIMAYLNRERDFQINKIRETIAIKSNIGVTFGWGPRFLHSTGQFHKGGQHNGAFLQITGDNKIDLDIPEQSFTFHDLLMAQALGDGQALTSRNFPVVRIHLKNREAGINELLTAVSNI
jgi:glucose-6-phosphate isomerase